MTAEEKILVYGNEFGNEYLSVDALIKSHRELLKRSRESDKMVHERIEWARVQARKEVLDANWIRIDELKKMTIAELANFIREDEND